MKNEKKDTWRIGQVFRLIIEHDSKYLYITTIVTICMSIIPVISLKIMQLIINLIQQQIGDMNLIFKLIVLYLVFDLLLIVFQFCLSFYKQKYSLDFNLRLKKRVLEKASRLSLRTYEESKTYDMLQRAENQTDGEILAYFDMIIAAIGIAMSSISYMLIVISFNPLIIPLLVIFPVIEFVISNKINREEFCIVKRRTNDARKAWYNGYIITSGINCKELKLNDLFDYFINKFENISRNFIKQDLYIGKKRTKSLLGLGVLEQLLTGGLFAYTIYSGYLGVILIGDVITYTRAMISAKSQIQGVIQMLAKMNKAKLSISQLFDFFLIDEETEENGIEIDEIKDIEIKKLSYKYPNSTNYALKNIELKLCRGDMAVIVGMNGSGKSTLMKVLLGMYNDYEGEIFVNGVNMKQINKKSYYNCISALFQDFTKYEGTIRENFCYNNLSILEQDGTILELCKQTGVSNLVMNQPEGLDTQLGYWFESGKQLSFGQWQKIALTRSFAKSADIYFYDEPDAALDSISESEIAKTCCNVFAERIGIIITHKFKHFINNANKIIVLNAGELVGIGTHEDLLEKTVEYQHLFHNS